MKKEIYQMEPRQTDLAFPPQPEKEKREKLLRRLEGLKHDVKEGGDLEALHMEADALILDYIGDPEISQAFNIIPKYYA